MNTFAKEMLLRFSLLPLLIAGTVIGQGSVTPAGKDDYLVIDLRTWRHRFTGTPPDISTDACRTTEFWLRRVPAGRFMMGSPKGDGDRDDDEAQHEVTLTEYYISVFECTQAQWRAVTGETPSQYVGDMRPVERVSYVAIRGGDAGTGWPVGGHGAVGKDSFLDKLRGRTGLMLDLPTEAQWEYACRAGEAGIAPKMSTYGRFDGNKGDGRGGFKEHTTVGSYAPNAWGLYDMRGNVAEWCLDWYGKYTFGVENPAGPGEGRKRVLRGGSWEKHDCRPSSRSSSLPATKTDCIGFRVVCPAFVVPSVQPKAKPMAASVKPPTKPVPSAEPAKPVGSAGTTSKAAVAVLTTPVSSASAKPAGSADTTSKAAAAAPPIKPAPSANTSAKPVADGNTSVKPVADVRTVVEPPADVLMTIAAGGKDALYLVVDLSDGKEAVKYPVRCTETAPKLNDDACRTTELWLRRVPKGTFTMGSPEDEVGHLSYNIETQHEVTLTRDYYIGVFECTQRQWELVMGGNPSYFKGDCRPVACVSYGMIRGTGSSSYGHAVDSTSFMGKLQAKTGLTFDLPTEAQWEHACRALTKTALNSRNNLKNEGEDSMVNKVGRYLYNQNDEKGGYSQHTKVGSYKPNAWGLYDMHGNVSELCLDWFGKYYGNASVSDPKGPSTGANRVLRGGGWNSDARHCRSANRDGLKPSSYNSYTGFRVICLP